MWTYKASPEQTRSPAADSADGQPRAIREAAAPPKSPSKTSDPEKKPQTFRTETARNTPDAKPAGWQDQTGLLASKGMAEEREQSARTKVSAKGVRPVEKGGELRPLSQHQMIFGLAYLAGLLLGSMAFAFLGPDAGTYAEFYMDALLRLYATAEPLRIFSSQFLAAFLQLSLTAFYGFCALGMPFLLLQLLVRGAVFGCFSAALLAGYRLQGALIAGILFWLPEVLGALLQILLSIGALRHALQLGRICFAKTGLRRPETSHRLLNLYMVICLMALIPCALSALLALLFGALIG